MWVFTPFGFFSVVRKPGDEYLTIRARVRKDLDELRRDYLHDLSETVHHGGTDYPYRARASADSVAQAMAAFVRDIDYSNFKDEVANRDSYERAHAYGQVWGALYDLEAKLDR